MLFTIINGEQYTIDINFEIYNNYNSFNNYLSEKLSNLDLIIKEKLNESYIKYIYKEKIINSNNYS